MSRINFDMKFDDNGINQIKKSMKKTPFAKVGVLSTTNSRTPSDDNSPSESSSNAEIGFKQEFGSLSEGVPMRSFLRMPLNKKTKDILKSVLSGNTLKELVSKVGLSGAAARMGAAGEAAVQEAFATRGFGQWQANAPFTIASKDSDAPLIDTKQLSTSVVSEVVK